MTTASYNPATGAVLGVQRSLLDIYQSLSALTAQQRNAVWTDFTSGSPPKWSLDRSSGAGTVMACSLIAVENPFAWVDTDPKLVKARLFMVAAYVLFNPLYLVNPSFAPTVNVPGYG